MAGSSHRTPLRSLEGRQDWHTKVRQECLKRVQDQRQQLLWQMRRGGSNSHMQAVQDAMSDIIHDVSRHAECVQTADASHRQRPESSTSPGIKQASQSQTDSISHSCNAEPPIDQQQYEELMLAMQQSLYEAEHAQTSLPSADAEAAEAVDEAEEEDLADQLEVLSLLPAWS